MGLQSLKTSFIDLTQDAVAIGYIEPRSTEPRIVYVNQAFIDELGYSSDEMTGGGVQRIHDPDTWDDFTTQVQPAFKQQQEKFTAESRLVRADGSKFWVSISFIVTPDKKNGGRHVSATYRDISKLKQAEATATEALKKSELAYQRSQRLLRRVETNQRRIFAAMNAYPEPIAIYDSNRRIFLWNRAFALTLTDNVKAISAGMTQEQIRAIGVRNGRVLSDDESTAAWVLPPEGDDYQPTQIDIEIHGGRHRRILRQRTVEGDHVIMCQDVTAVVIERLAAKEARDRLISALNAYPEPIVIYDSELYLVCWNDAYARAITTEPDLLVEGMHLRDVLAHASTSGRYKDAIGREEEWIEGVLSEVASGVPLQDVELTGDIHFRLSRSRASNGDYVAVRMNTTEFVRQKRTAEAVQTRLIAALNAYPSPFAIYDANERLVVWNYAYRDSMTSDPEALQAGMSAVDVTRIAIKEGKFVSAKGNESNWMSDAYHEKRAKIAVEDVELEGDVHHRVLRSRAENGDLMLLRIDTTELVRQQRTLEVTQERLMSAINAYPDPFAIYDADLNLLIWNPAYARSMSDQPDKVKAGMNLKELLLTAARAGKIPAASGREQAWVEEYYHPDILSPGVEDFEFEHDQHYRMVRSRAVNGEYVVLRINITEVVRQQRAVEKYAEKLEQANQAITHKALHDELTDLGNRRYLSVKLQEFFKRRRLEGGEIAVLHIDLDRFKQINDTMGHPAGDTVLRDTAKRICSHLRDQDVVARIGGDEFVVLIFSQDEDHRAEQLAKTLITDLSRPIYHEGKECRFGASIGLARTPLGDVDELLTNSDVALYKAKNAGRGQLSIFDTNDLDEMRRNKRVADEVMRAIESEEFIPFYQPQVDSKTGEIVGMEALARWRHPEKGILAPDSFLSVATDLNVAADIDRMIFERAIEECQQGFGHWDTPPSLSFNVSAKRIEDADFHVIRDYVKSYSGQVAFELLETIFLEEEDTSFLFQLDRLRDLGIAIEVDDFGSGRASVVALQRIGPDRVKIDRRLIAPVTQSASGLRMTRSIVEIGIALGMGVTAEGVETREQADTLAELGCDRLQGYYFAKPMNYGALVQFIHERGNVGEYPNRACGVGG